LGEKKSNNQANDQGLQFPAPRRKISSPSYWASFLIRLLTLLVTIGGPDFFPDLLFADWSTPFSALSCCNARLDGDGGIVSDVQPASASPAATRHDTQNLTATFEFDRRTIIQLDSPQSVKYPRLSKTAAIRR
jgi:hypothetical protein